jgi:hypothetical protein
MPTILEIRRAGLVTALALVMCLLGATARAQIDAGNINGLVTDETGGSLPGVTVTARNLATGQIRTVATGADGRYQIAALPPGTYSVTAELSGFANVVRPEITVNVGSTADVNIQMGLATVSENVTVTGEAPIVESTKTTLSAVVTREVLEALPTRNRDYLGLTLLMPSTGETTVNGENGSGFAVGGAKGHEGALLVDGFYNLDINFIQPKQRHSQDLVQEFQFVTFGGSAEYGRAIGGIVNVVTKSGTNDFRGSTYGFFRNAKLNAVDFSQKAAGGTKAPYDRQQWGGTFGGPVRRNQSFFIGSFERLNENLPTNTGIRPADLAAIGLPPTAALMPRAMDSKFVFGKYDHNISQNQRLQFGFSFTRQIETTSWWFTLTTRSRWYQLNPDDYSATGKWQGNSEDGRKLHEVKVSYFPRRYFVDSQKEDGRPLCNCTLNETWPTSNSSPPRVNVSGVASFGSAGLVNYFNSDPVHAIYTSTVFTNKHAIKFGADWLYGEVRYELYSPLVGTYSFPNLQAYLAGQYSQYTQSFGDTRLPRTYNMSAAFIQDSWQLHRRLALNYGLRYDLDIPVKYWKTGTPFGKTDYNNFGPRAALSYDLTGKGHTFLKMSSGVYYDRIWGNDSLNMFIFKDAPQRTSATWTRTTAGAPVFPNVFSSQPAQIPRAAIDAMIMPVDANVPTTAQVVGTFEHMLTPNLAFRADAVYTRSWNKQFSIDTNLGWDDALNGGRGGYYRIDPNYRQITQRQFGAPAEYQAGIVEVERRGSKFTFSGNVTVARSRNVDLLRVNDLRTYQSSGFAYDYGPNANTPTVRGSVSGVYNVSRSFQLSGALKARTGLPVDPVASGLDLNGDGVLNDRTPGLGPFSFRGRSMHSLDLRLTWNLPLRLGEARRLQVYVESFNLTNHENISNVLNDYGPTAGAPRSRWLEPSLWFPPRELQLGFRLAF